MPFIAAGAAAVSIFSNIMGGLAQDEAHQHAAGIQYGQTGNQKKVFEEQNRRQEIKDAQVLGGNTAAAYASGFYVPGSTTGKYLEQMKTEQDQEMAFAKDQQWRTLDLMRSAANLTAQGGDSALLSSVLQGAATGLNSVNSISKAFNLFGGGAGGADSGLQNGATEVNTRDGDL